jgi:transcription termination factor NusA
MASLLEVSGIGPASAKHLAEHGIHSAEDLAGAKLRTLIAIPGFSQIRAKQVIAAAKDLTKISATDAGEKPSKAKPEGKQKSVKQEPGKKEKKKKGKKKKEKKQEKMEKPAKSKKVKKSPKTSKPGKKSGKKK